MSNYIRLVAVLLVIVVNVPLSASANAGTGATASAVNSRRDIVLSLEPQKTDPDAVPAMDSSLGNHLVWPVDPSRTPGSVDKTLLYLFLPATGAKPSDYTLIQQEAVDLGYHVIGLAYPNADAVIAKCNPITFSNADDVKLYKERQACYLSVRMQTLDGTTPSNYTNVKPSNSIDNRLEKLLVYLREHMPNEGWGGFLDETGSPAWSRIIVAGHSQGGGNAALMGKLHRVARVVMISSPPDGCFDASIPDQNGVKLPGSLPGCTDPATPPVQPGAEWTGPGGLGTPHLTPADRYFALAHQSEFTFSPAFASRPPMLANWSRLGLGAFGLPVSADTAGAPPYGCSHMLVTSLPAPGLANIALSLQDHRLTARDDYTPTDANHVPLLRDAWRYISAVATGSQSGCTSGRLDQ